ncbi:MAG: tyrosine-type recombinase/integrase [Steroidobacteraceae bacterium]
MRSVGANSGPSANWSALLQSETLPKRRFRDAGVPYHGVHAFRRTFAIAYLEPGDSAQDRQEIAGWQSIQMVQLYTRATANARADENTAACPPPTGWLFADLSDPVGPTMTAVVGCT